MNKIINQVTARISLRSQKLRAGYLVQIEKARMQGPQRKVLHCGNLAHSFAAANITDKQALRSMVKANIAIVSAYNDILSAHQPYGPYPSIIKQAIKEAGHVAQFAGGVPAMCDGVTQGQPGMELSLMSRDIIAMASAVALSHNMFDGGLMLGICDKIVPGLLMSALSFGHLPFVFVPAGPMPTGLSNKEKSTVRNHYAQGKADRDTLLDAETQSYHAPGTCTFYGTANSNQLIVELMGLQLPGSSFVNPNTALRYQLTKAAAKKVTELTDLGNNYRPIGLIVDAKVLVNGMIGLLASGGSTNHTIHLVAIARCAGLIINWDDFADLSAVVPLLARIYPNGNADINQFHEAGGMAYFISTLLDQGLLHQDVLTILGHGLEAYTQVPTIVEDQLTWQPDAKKTADDSVLRSALTPFSPEAGLKVLTGNMGRAIIKTSALPQGIDYIRAPAVVFTDQTQLKMAFEAGDLDRDCVVVVRFQGPKACGMPELHQLTPALSVLQTRGFKIALVTDGRMSGASGKVPAAIHVTPEAVDGGIIAKINTGDIIVVDCNRSLLHLEVSDSVLNARNPASLDLTPYHHGLGRELLTPLRTQLTSAEQGACSFNHEKTYE